MTLTTEAAEGALMSFPHTFATRIDQISDNLVESVEQFTAEKQQHVAFELSKDRKRTALAQTKVNDTRNILASLARCTSATQDVLALQEDMLDKASRTKRILKDVHFSTHVDDSAQLSLHVYDENEQFHVLDQGTHLNAILESKFLWIAPRGTRYDPKDVHVCKRVEIALDAADATRPERLGFIKHGYVVSFRNPPRYKLVDGQSVNDCRLLADTYHLGITQDDPHKKRKVLVDEFIQIWRLRDLGL